MAAECVTRRDFMAKVSSLSVCVALGAYHALPSKAHSRERVSDGRPNILFCLADDWSWPHAGAYGDTVVVTPTFDRIAKEGILFANAFCSAPTCTASRGAILTGQDPHRLEEGGNLWSLLQKKFVVYPDILENAGYRVGYSGKGWSPGSDIASGRSRNPAGPRFTSFGQFLADTRSDRPFCFWFGSLHPHRPYARDSGVASGMNPDAVKVPPFLPDTPEVRGDILDYYCEVQQFDQEVAAVLKTLEDSGLADNTIVVMTSDNGMPFPRAKANLYEAGCHMPLAIRWPARIQPGRKTDALVSFTDFAPTFLEAAGIEVPRDMTGKSLLNLLIGSKFKARTAVFFERERHANVRKGDRGYPSRAVRTKDFLYIRNFEPQRWPAGDPELYYAVGPFGDIDGGPAKDMILARRDDPEIAEFFRLACERRPAEELFDLSTDPWCLVNVASKPEYSAQRTKMRYLLDGWMESTADPRAKNPHDDRWDRYQYFGDRAQTMR